MNFYLSSRFLLLSDMEGYKLSPPVDCTETTDTKNLKGKTAVITGGKRNYRLSAKCADQVEVRMESAKHTQGRSLLQGRWLISDIFFVSNIINIASMYASGIWTPKVVRSWHRSLSSKTLFLHCSLDLVLISIKRKICKM